ncbi:CHAT domain-containing protein [Aquimarina sp. 2304DJ70-9]|uniref:CHAT domain-containing protein n=1 Tax=Aquimarina penaris TaxID=3231044 RepID=UPI003462B054
MKTRKIIILLVIIVGFFTYSTNAQVATDTLLASQYYKKADSFLEDRKLDSSIVYFKKALPVYQKAKAWDRVAGCYNKIASSQRYNSKYKEVLLNTEKALKISSQYLKNNNREEAYAYDNLALYHEHSTSDFNNASIYFKKALQVRNKMSPKNHEDIALSFIRMGDLDLRQGFMENALENFNKSLTTLIDAFGEHNAITWDSYERIGKVYRELGKFNEALTNYEKALEVTRKNFGENHPKTAYMYSTLGVTYRAIADYIKSEFYLKKALESRVKFYGEKNRSVAFSYYSLGILNKNIGKYELSINYFSKALKLFIELLGENSTQVANTYYGLGLFFLEKDSNNIALEYFQKSVSIFKQKNKNHPSLCVAYNAIGNCFKNTGSYEQSLEYFNMSLTLATLIYGKENFRVGSAYQNIGFVYKELENYDEALTFLEKGTLIMKNSFETNHHKITMGYRNIGNILKIKGKYQESLQYFQKALNTQINKNDDTAYTFDQIALLNQEIGEYGEALEFFENSLKIRQKLFGINNSLVAKSYNLIANFFLERKLYQKALINYDKAIISNTKLDTLKNNLTNLNQYYNNIVLLTTLQGQAKTNKKIYLKSNDLAYLKNAISIYQKEDALINTIRQSFTNYQDKVTFAKQAKEVYQRAIEAQLLWYEAENDQQALEKAFYYAERSKANALKEMLAASNAKNFTGLSTDLITLEKELRINKAFYQSKVTEEHSEKDADSSKITQYENKLFEINRRQDSLTEVLEKNYPKYYQLKYQNDIVSVGKLQQQLNERTTVVEFFTSDSITYAFTITKNTIAIKELATPSLEKKVEQFRDAITSKHVGDFKASAHQLYQQLIAPIADQFVGDELIIIPDGPLWHLNVELLLTQNKDSNNPKDLPYLLHDYAISYANSANLLFTNHKDAQKSKKQEECLAFSFTDSTSVVDTKTMSLATLRDAGDDLPGTRKEIKAIAEIINGQYYFGSEAIEVNFKKNAGQYNILHLALHGEVDNERPENSRLYFTKSKDTIEDNLLYGHELFALDIPAELTVLSACNTGSGKIAKGEGIMSLGTAFQYAGTKSLLLTSWEVSDQTTPELMKYFYTNLKAGMNKAKALQQAKLQYLKTADINRTHPFYWGGFYLVGDAAAIPFSDYTWWYWVLGLVLFGILFLAMFWFRKRKHDS